MKTKKFVSKKDIVIPAGTVFENCDGCKTEYASGNYRFGFGLTKDSSGTLVYGIDELDKDLPEWFEEIKDGA